MLTVRLALKPGRAVGVLADGEDASTLVQRAMSVRDHILRGELIPLVHGDVTGYRREHQISDQIHRLRRGRLKRYVVRIETAAGPRILKLSEAGNRWRALGSSRARREHLWHARAQNLGIAASETRGFLELRQGPWLIRGVQVQTVLDPQMVSLGVHLTREIERHGRIAVDRFAEHLAHAHKLRFFHADLKGFHAFVTDTHQCGDTPAHYRLLWSDFGRVGFRISSRRRVINLYQALRFIVPRDRATQQRFVQRYCEFSGWKKHRTDQAFSQVIRFLERKLRTHPLATP